MNKNLPQTISGIQVQVSHDADSLWTVYLAEHNIDHIDLALFATRKEAREYAKKLRKALKGIK